MGTLDKDQVEYTGRTALAIAADRAHREAVQLLLQAKANANLADLDGKTPADLARERDDTDMVHDLTMVPKDNLEGC